MTLAAILGKDQWEKLGEDFQKEYIEKDGKFVLDVRPVDGFALEDISGLKTALETERENSKKAAENLKSFGDLDPKAAKAALDKLEEIKNFDPDAMVKAGMEQREADLIKAHGAELEKISKEATDLRGQLQSNLITAAATKALADAEGSISLLLPHVERFTRMKQNEHGQFVAEVINADGVARVGDGQGNPMTIPQLVEEMKSKDDFAAAFKGTKSSGTGATGVETKTDNDGKERQTGTVDISDQNALNNSLEGLASGDVKIAQ